jgi:hypothetical protein
MGYLTQSVNNKLQQVAANVFDTSIFVKKEEVSPAQQLVSTLVHQKFSDNNWSQHRCMGIGGSLTIGFNTGISEFL